MRDAGSSLREAMDEYLADAPYFSDRPIQPRTIRKYAYVFYRFDCRKIADPPSFKPWQMMPVARSPLGDLNPNEVRSFMRRLQVAGKSASAATAAVALKALARRLATDKVWYANGGISVLDGISVPQPSATGRITFTDDELRTIHRVASEGPNSLFHDAVLYISRHGLRPDEVRRLTRDDVVVPNAPGQRGSIHVTSSKTPAGVRQMPLEPKARNFIVRYLRDGRPSYRGCFQPDCSEHPDGPNTPEPVFITDDGQPFHEGGWKSVWRRFSDRMEAAGVTDFVPYRLRGTRARELKEAGWGDSEVIQVMGWSAKNGQKMLRRYVGDYTPKHLRSLPTTFERIA